MTDLRLTFWRVIAVVALLAFLLMAFDVATTHRSTTSVSEGLPRCCV